MIDKFYLYAVIHLDIDANFYVAQWKSYFCNSKCKIVFSYHVHSVQCCHDRKRQMRLLHCNGRMNGNNLPATENHSLFFLVQFLKKKSEILGVVYEQDFGTVLVVITPVFHKLCTP